MHLRVSPRSARGRELLARLVARSTDGVHPDPLELLLSDRDLVEDLVVGFGGLDLARKHAGLVPPPRKLTAQTASAWLRALAATGWRVTPPAVRELGEERVVRWTYRYGGGFAAFKRGLRLPPMPRAAARRAMTPADVLAEMRRILGSGGALSHRSPRQLVREIAYHYGSMTIAKIALRLSEPDAGPREWTADRVVKALADRLSARRPTAATSLMSDGEAELLIGAMRHFGTVRQAVAHAQVHVTQQRGRGESTTARQAPGERWRRVRKSVAPAVAPSSSGRRRKVPPTGNPSAVERAPDLVGLTIRWAAFATACRAAAEGDAAMPDDLETLPREALAAERVDLIRTIEVPLLTLLARRAEMLTRRRPDHQHRGLASTIAALGKAGVIVPLRLWSVSRPWLSEDEPKSGPQRQVRAREPASEATSRTSRHAWLSDVLGAGYTLPEGIAGFRVHVWSPEIGTAVEVVNADGEPAVIDVSLDEASFCAAVGGRPGRYVLHPLAGDGRPAPGGQPAIYRLQPATAE